MIVGGTLAAAALVLIALHFPWVWQIAIYAMFGFGFYLLHSCIQLHVTDLSHTARGAAASLHSCFVLHGAGRRARDLRLWLCPWRGRAQHLRRRGRRDGGRPDLLATAAPPRDIAAGSLISRCTRFVQAATSNAWGRGVKFFLISRRIQLRTFNRSCVNVVRSCVNAVTMCLVGSCIKSYRHPSKSWARPILTVTSNDLFHSGTVPQDRRLRHRDHFIFHLRRQPLRLGRSAGRGVDAKRHRSCARPGWARPAAARTRRGGRARSSVGWNARAGMAAGRRHRPLWKDRLAFGIAGVAAGRPRCRAMRAWPSAICWLRPTCPHA